MAYSCRDGACGSCKCRLVEGQVEHGAHRPSALTDGEAQEGFILPCVAQPLTDCLLQARSVEPAAQAVRKMPIRVAELRRAAPDVMVLRMQLPANQEFTYRAGQYLDLILRDGSRRSYSMATAPQRLGSPPMIELHLRHMPGGQFTDHVFASLKERDVLRMEGPLGSFHLREDSRRPIVLLASGTGFAPIRAILQRMQDLGDDRPAVLYWGGRRSADLYLHDWALQAELAMPGFALRAGAVGTGPPGWLDRPHRLRPPRSDGGLARPVGPRGLCLRCARGGGVGAARLRGAMRAARRALPRRQLHQCRRPRARRRPGLACHFADARLKIHPIPS